MRKVGRRDLSRKIKQNSSTERVLFHLNEDLLAFANVKFKYERIFEILFYNYK